MLHKVHVCPKLFPHFNISLVFVRECQEETTRADNIIIYANNNTGFKYLIMLMPLGMQLYREMYTYLQLKYLRASVKTRYSF